MNARELRNKADALLAQIDKTGERRLRPDHPAAPSATPEECFAWLTYLRTKTCPRGYVAACTKHDADPQALSRYIAKTDLHLRDIGVWK